MVHSILHTPGYILRVLLSSAACCLKYLWREETWNFTFQCKIYERNAERLPGAVFRDKEKRISSDSDIQRKWDHLGLYRNGDRWQKDHCDFFIEWNTTNVQQNHCLHTELQWNKMYGITEFYARNAFLKILHSSRLFFLIWINVQFFYVLWLCIPV